MATFNFNIQQIIRLAGIAQLTLVIGSLAIPKILNWRGELARVGALIRQMFWTYAAYILVINFCFGLISVLDAQELANGSRLSMLVCGFIAAYWISRVLIQFLYFDRSAFPTNHWSKIGEVVLVWLFIFLSLVYSWAFYYNFMQTR